MKVRTKRMLAVLAVLTMLFAVLCGGMAASAEEAAVQATSMKLNREELTMLPGKTFTMKLRAMPEGSDTTGTVWTSDNEAVALASNGVITAVAKGEATVTATMPNGLTDTCKVTVVSGEVIVKNSTFDDADQTAWMLGGSAVIEATGGHGNTACVKMGYESTLSQLLPSCKAGTAYQVVLSTKMTASETITAKVLDGTSVVAEETLSLGQSWGTRYFEFTAPDAITDLLVLQFENPNTEGAIFYLDNVVIAEKTADVDLTVEAVDWEGGDGQVKPGTELTFTVTVANEGTEDVTEPFDVDIALGTQVIMTLTHEGGVKAGETVEITAEPWAAVEGDKMLSAHVNPALTVAESNYDTNNTYQTNLRVAEDRLTPAYNADVVAEAGMFDLTFSDDFDSLSNVDTLGSGLEGYKWYVNRRWNQVDMTPADYFIKDGVFTVQHLDSRYAIGASTVDAYTRTGYTFNKGYLEVKLRIPVPEDIDGANGKPAIWSHPIGKWCEIPGQNKHWVEMDWLEYYGDAHYTITLHDQDKKENGTMVSWQMSTDNARLGLDDKEWHVMGFVWEEDHLRCYVDGELVREQTWAADDIPNPMHLYMEGTVKSDGVFDLMDEQDMMLYIAGGRDIPLELDYVRIWQFGGEEPTTDDTNDEPQPEQSPATGAVPGVCAVLTAAAAAVAALATRKKRVK